MIEKTENKFEKVFQINNSWLILLGVIVIGVIVGYLVLFAPGNSSGLAGKALQGNESSQLSAGAMPKAKPQNTQTQFNSFIEKNKKNENYQNYTINCSGAIISDATHDGVTTTTDALIIFNYAMGIGEIEVIDENICCMDFDNSNHITTTDALGAFQVALGMRQSPGYCPIWCSDSDNGINIFTSGNVTINESEVFSDACPLREAVVEYYCDENHEAAYSLESCPYNEYYYEDYCANGACSPIDYQCTDTDGGQNYTETGTINSSAYFNGEELFHFEFTDECLDPGRLKEWFCVEGHQDAIEYNCPEGQSCSDGACVEDFLCSDTDGGINFILKGTASEWNEEQQQYLEYTDYCFAPSYLIEYYCLTQVNVGMQLHACAGCNDGACPA